MIFLFTMLFVVPVADLANKDDLKTVKLVYAEEILEVEHSISYIIPFGKDHYYLGIDDEDNAYIIHGPKKWAEKNFSDSDDNSVKITALAKKISDYEIEDELNSSVGVMRTHFPLGISTSLELTYVKDAVMRIISGVLLIALTIVGFKSYKKRDELPPIAVKIYVVAVIVTLILTLMSIR
ncbi:MAG: hypothetical protein NC093_06700 [Alistipes sp.]|nr:hypothetical protein [Alistipes sp.]